jgi:hypothetical protein
MIGQVKQRAQLGGGEMFADVGFSPFLVRGGSSLSPSQTFMALRCTAS